MNGEPGEYRITCPWCWEVFSTWLEAEAQLTELVEDCQICCHPIQIRLETDFDGQVSLHAERAM